MNLLRTFAAAFVFLAVGANAAFAQTATAAKKPALPDAAALKESNAVIEELFKADFKAAQTPELKGALAEKFLAAAKSEQDSLARCALYQRARELAVAAGNVAPAIAAIEALEGEYDCDALKLSLDSALATSKTSLTAPQKRALAVAAGALADKAIAGDRIDIATPAAETALGAARGSDDVALVRQMTEKVQQASAISATLAKIKPALTTLASKPDDPAANFEVGQFNCLVRGKWEEGLPQLAKGSNTAYKALAEAELKKPATAEAQVALADGWWDAAQKETGSGKTQLMIHAGQWYQSALPEISGLAKAKLDKRLADVAALAGAAALTGNSKTVNLMALYNAECVVGGTWELKDGTLIAGSETGTRVEFPYEPPEEYDFHIVFTRTSGDDGIVQILSSRAKSFVWAMGSKGNTAGGLGRINGADPVNNKSRVNLPIAQGTKYDSVVQVRKTGVRVLLDGKQILDWKTDYTDFSIYEGWKLRSNKTLGVGSWRGGVVYYKMEVTEVTGKGKVLK